MLPVLEMSVRKHIRTARNRFVCSIKVGMYHMLICQVALVESCKEIWKEECGFGQGCPWPWSDFWLLSVALPGQVLDGCEQRSTCCIRGRRKRLEAVTTFVSSTCNNILKYKNSFYGKDPVFHRLVCNTGKQKISLVIQSLNY